MGSITNSGWRDFYNYGKYYDHRAGTKVELAVCRRERLFWNLRQRCIRLRLP